MFRGRGYRGGGMPNQNFRGGAQGMRGGFQPGRPHANKKEALKFEKDYDFEEANQEFAEVLSKLQVTSIYPIIGQISVISINIPRPEKIIREKIQNCLKLL